MARQDAVSHAVGRYLTELRRTRLSEKTEHTDRGALQALLESLAPPGSIVINEPKRVRGKGSPDFKIRHDERIVGYLEVKPVGTKLDEVVKSEQLARYRSLSKNILVTNYLDWVWLHGDHSTEFSLGPASSIFASKLKAESVSCEGLAALISAFASVPPRDIATANELADALAHRSRLLRDFLDQELARQETHGQGERLYGLFAAFKQQVSAGITLADFADAFAQTLAYGLFLAKLNAGRQKLGLANAKQHIPSSFKLIQELVSFLDVLEADFYRDIKWVVDEILSIINGIDTAAVRESLSYRNRRGAYRNLHASSEEEWRLFSRDPFVYFYEDYLAQYDAALRKRRGVYYTPPPVVNFIVRSIDEILKTKFSLNHGLADDEHVTVLDFACGTGTFVVEIVQQIMESVSSSAKAELLLKEHVLKNVYAFEYLIAPYTIAHLKLAQYLEDRQMRSPAEKFNILLTNTLEPLEPQHNYLLPALSEETERALRVKKSGVLVITGNPPYAGHSQNRGDWIAGQVRKYRDGVPELSRPGQGKWLQNDYVKFLRFAQYEMDRSPEGLVAVITDNSYLDNPTFRGMRKSLMESFDQIYIVDLHGNSNKKERAPDGGNDENVFDIKQGVAVALFVKKPGATKGVWRADLWGRRIDKYKALADARFSAIDWQKIDPREPDHLFIAVSHKGMNEYRSLWSLPEIFSQLGDPAPGIVTTHDEFAISFSRKEAAAKVARLLATKTEDEARRMFRLCKQSQWDYAAAKRELAKADIAGQVVPVLYQPFDRRWTVWNGNVAVHRRERVMNHMRQQNLALMVIRKADVQGEWRHALATSQVATHHALSMKEINYLFPLYAYPAAAKGAQRDLFEAEGANRGPSRIENFSPKFRDWLDRKYGHHFEPEEIFGFVYATLFAPEYRAANKDFLRMDFPRIPFPKPRGEFAALARLGWAMVQAHLMKDLPKSSVSYGGRGANAVTKPSYSEAEERLYINDTQYFDGIAKPVWEFQVGGYQPLSKFLKSRKTRTLSLSEIRNVENIASVQAFTLAQTQRIGALYGKMHFH